VRTVNYADHNIFTFSAQIVLKLVQFNIGWLQSDKRPASFCVPSF